MTPAEYTKEALQTTTDLDPVRLALEVAAEAGEVAAVYAKAMRHGTTPFSHRVIDECGDVLWSVAVLLHAVGSSLDEAMQANVAKLRARHSDSRIVTGEIAQAFRDGVRDRRRERQVTIRAACGLAGMTPSEWSRIESTEGPVSLDTIDRMREAIEQAPSSRYGWHIIWLYDSRMRLIPLADYWTCDERFPEHIERMVAGRSVGSRMVYGVETADEAWDVVLADYPRRTP